MPDAYRVAPLPVLALFSGVLSKVGAYGFLRIVLPVFPAATIHFQEMILVVARRLDPLRLGDGVHADERAPDPGYSSVAQLGFITLGIFSLRPDGADGAVLQMVNHGLVVAPLMLIVVLLVARGPARRTSPRWAAWRCGRRCSPPCSWCRRWHLLAMPGSSNFMGEFYILNGVFQSKIVFAFVAAIGIALAAYYALRLYQRAMHNRRPDGIESREIGLRDGAVVAALVACIVALALYPGLILHRG